MVSKIALITGGSRGLGKNMALQLAAKGIDIIITYHTQQALADKVVAAIKTLCRKAVALPLNVAGFAQLNAFVALLTKTLATEFQ